MSGTGLWPERRADRPDRPGATDLAGDPAVRPDLAVGDLQRLEPDVALEVGVAAQVEVDAHAPVALEASGDGRRQPVGHAVLGVERRAARSRPHGGPRRRRRRGSASTSDDAQAVPGHDDRADRRLDAGVVVGQPDGHEDARAQRGRGRDDEPAQRGLDGGVGGGHAVISWGSDRRSASSIVRNRAIPRWTWALTVPSGRPRAAAVSG